MGTGKIGVESQRPRDRIISALALRASIQATKQESKSAVEEPAAEEQPKPKARSRKKAAEKVG